MTMMDQRTMIIIGQLFMIALAAILALAPQLYTVAIILYFAGIFGFSIYRSRKGAGQGVSREEVERARTLFREEKAMDLAAQDDDYLREVSKQVKSMFIPLLLFPVYIAIFKAVPSLEPSFAEHLRSLGINDVRVARLILWIAAFEAMFLLNQAVRIVAGGSSKPAPLVPPAYRVTEKGIVIKGGLGSVIGFPLPEDAQVRVDESKKYVEIEMRRGIRYRFYTTKPRRLYDLLMRYAFAKESSGDASRADSSQEPRA